SVTLNDIPEAELLIIIGQNPGTNSPRMLSALQQLKKNGGKIIAINPLPEAGFMQFRHPQKPWEWIGNPTQLQDLYLPIKINGDIAFLKALIRILWEDDQKSGGVIFDHVFIESQTTGFHELIEEIKKSNLTHLIQ